MPSKELVIPKYCESIYQTRRRPTRTVMVRRWRAAFAGMGSAGRAAGAGLWLAPSVRAFGWRFRAIPAKACNNSSTPAQSLVYCPQIGKVPVGSQHRVALQTMTTTDTRNVQATVDQVGHGGAGDASMPCALLIAWREEVHVRHPTASGWQGGGLVVQGRIQDEI